MTLADVERVVGIVERVQPQVALAIQAAIGLAKWIGRRRESNLPPPTDDAVLAAWKQASAALDRGKASLEGASADIERNLSRLP